MFGERCYLLVYLFRHHLTGDGQKMNVVGYQYEPHFRSKLGIGGMYWYIELYWIMCMKKPVMY